MPTTEFREFSSFRDISDAAPLLRSLNEHKIEYQVSRKTSVFDPSFANNSTGEIVVYILSKDFEKAKDLMEAYEEPDLKEIPADYYLFSFTDTELRDVLIKQDEWNSMDVKLAQKILCSRGQEMSEIELSNLRKKRIDALSQYKPFPLAWIIAGYAFSLLGGLIGIAIGAYLHFDTKSLPDGSKMHTFEPGARLHGLVILALGVLLFIISVWVQIWTKYQNAY